MLDLEWWVTNLATANSRPVKPLLPDMLIQSDAAGSGWGAVCNRIETRGTWSLHESSLHINCLELLAATYAIEAFTKSLSNAHVLIQMDNTSAIAYVNKMGEAKQGVLDKHARSLWDWCLARKITLRAEHIPGRLNVVADAESRAKPDAADWKLDPEVFKVLNHSFGPFTVGEILQLSARPPSRAVRCPGSALVGRECLRLPPFQLDQQMSEEDKPRRSNFVDHMPSVASAGMVPPPPTVANRQSSFAC